MAEPDNLDGQITVVAPTEAHQLGDSDEGEIEKRQGMGQFRHHRPIRESAAQATGMTFSASTGQVRFAVGGKGSSRRGGHAGEDGGRRTSPAWGTVGQWPDGPGPNSFRVLSPSSTKRTP